MTEPQRRRGTRNLAGDAELDLDGLPAERLRSLLAELDERHRRIAERLAYGYGYDSEIPGWFAQLRKLESERDRLRAAIAASESATGEG